MPKKISLIENLFPPIGHGNRQPRLYPPGVRELVEPHIVEPKPEELEAQEAAAKAHQQAKEAKERKSQSSHYVAVELAALLASIQSINFQLPPLFQPLMGNSKGSEIGWTLAGVGASLLTMSYFIRQHAGEIPVLGSRARLALKVAGVLGLGASVYTSSQNLTHTTV